MAATITLILICYSITLSLMVMETMASETSVILNDTTTTQNSIENSTLSNASGSKNVENITETNQTGSISGRISSLMSPSLGGNCTVC